MTTTMLGQVPAGRISERAQQVKPGRTALNAVLGVFTVLGWLAGKVFTVLWVAFTHAWAAVAYGWEAARGPSRGQQIAALTAEVQRLSDEVRRFGGPG